MVWERSGGGIGNGVVSEEHQKRHKVMGFVGIQTGFGSVGRRRSLRQTWMPSDRQGLQRYVNVIYIYTRTHIHTLHVIILAKFAFSLDLHTCIIIS